jgi:hypothetical protein
MPFPTNAASTELDAVNQILSSVGQAPVTTLDLENPEVAIPLNTLKEVSKQVQVEGWTFNLERNVVLQRESDNTIIYPLNALAIDINTDYHLGQYDVVRRENKVYDRLHHTNVFTEDLHCDILYYIDFQFLPPSLQAYITAKAARIAAIKMVGDGAINELLAEQEAMTRAFAIEQDCQQGDYTIFGHADDVHYSSYQPFNALQR